MWGKLSSHNDFWCQCPLFFTIVLTRFICAFYCQPFFSSNISSAVFIHRSGAVKQGWEKKWIVLNDQTLQIFDKENAGGKDSRLCVVNERNLEGVLSGSPNFSEVSWFPDLRVVFYTRGISALYSVSLHSQVNASLQNQNLRTDLRWVAKRILASRTKP